ncbi:exodeoxyribonuclease V subunit beta [Thalassotalea euphylliae]|uniref:RecBCD enzyme subunit RecB n=1 Tax=Thalassotalea euphylliae TaxID=1655234 RepID=A0A3E0UIF8_9GAMM|nr:exodeoxyribonuclease V subunit beta [Thalassotalea euphylliae]REL35542.1 exodeoxyribonuclease V subunit beta [Thalassotalea euphylliae]
MKLQPLFAEHLPLSGRHLIEASAGTGKTFNITRIYLRLLLEKGLTVEQILVMTFTKDATEEIKSRIGQTLRNTIAKWDELTATEPFYQEVAKDLVKTEAMAKLHRALLFLDDAAIFTIHGFCKRVLSEFAFDSGLLFNLVMESSCQEQTLEAVQDWYRLIAKQDPDSYLTIAEFWPEPEQFVQVFSGAIDKHHSITTPSTAELCQQINALAVDAANSLSSHQSFLFEHLVNNQKGAKKEERISEYEQLASWLNNATTAELSQLLAMPSMPASFIDGRRFGRSKAKAEIVEIVSPVNELKPVIVDIAGQVKRIQAYEIIARSLKSIADAVAEKKQRLGLLSFDDLIAILAQQLSSGDAGRILANKLAKQYPAAMVDEFQDTDPNQFDILTNIYQNTDNAALYLIGDPKQAIYAFRGGDIFTYLSARDFCQYFWVMDTNWRSSAEMIQGYNRLFYGTALDQSAKHIFGKNIPYFPVAASNTVEPVALADNDLPLQFVHFPFDDESATAKPAQRAEMAQWLAQKIVSLLNDNQQQVSASDIAILVRDGTEAAIVKQALTEHQLASVYLSNRSNLWHSEQAQQLLLVLKAVLFLEQDRYFNAGLASGLLGHTPSSLLALSANELAWQEVKFSFKAIRDEWQYKGFISAALKLLHEHVAVNGEHKERALTNLLHLFELLQAASARYHQPLELLYWFEQQISTDSTESDAELRLESDEQLIKIVTQHGSKGLEYPIVFVPFASRHKNPSKIGNRNVTVIEYHDEQGQLHTRLSGNKQQVEQMAEEAYAESIRLLYVAVTRAVQRCYLLVANFDKVENSPLGKTLTWSADVVISGELQALSQQYPNAIGYRAIGHSAFEKRAIADDKIGEQNTEIAAINNVGANTNINANAKASPELATFTSKIERDWWLSSFTALSKNLRHGGVSLPDRDLDQPMAVSAPGVNRIGFDLAKGAQTGNLLHDLLEQGDFHQGDWRSLSAAMKIKYAALLEGWSGEELAAWCEQLVTCEIAEDLSLANIAPKAVLKEQEFYFPMEQASSQKLAVLVYQHRQRLLARSNSQSKAVKLPAYQALKGMMHGFIDLIFEYEGKYYVCDYKSTHLGDSFEHYHGEALQQNIADNYYDLQYFIYCLALHRLLKSRIDDYDPAQHFGGVFYLYLRGMKNKQTAGERTGVFFSDISSEELDELDALFSNHVSLNQATSDQVSVQSVE